jgi:hypothetical protein
MKQLQAESLTVFPYDLTLPFLILSIRVRVHNRNHFSDRQILFRVDKETVAAVVIKPALVEMGSSRKKRNRKDQFSIYFYFWALNY